MSLARQRISQHEPPAGTHLFLGTDSRSSPGAAGRARGERGRRGHGARVGPRTARRCPGRRGNFLASFVPRKARGSGAELRAPHARKVTERRGARQAPFAALPALSSTWSANRERSRSQTRSSKRRGGGTGGSKGARNGRARGRSPRAERLQPSAPSPLLSSRQSSGAPDPALPAASSVPPPEREVNRSALEGAPLRKLTFDLPGFALLPAGHAAGGRSCLAPGTERSGEGRLRAVTDQQTALIEGPRPPRNDEWDRGGAGRGEERVWRREEERGERERGGESGRESGGREGGGGKERGREGGRGGRKEGEREGGESRLLALSLPLSPALCRCRAASAPRAALRSDWRAAGGGGEGGGEGGAFRDGGGRNEGVCPSALTGSGCSRRRVRVRFASRLRVREASDVPALSRLWAVTFRRGNDGRNSVTAAQPSRGVPRAGCFAPRSAARRKGRCFLPPWSPGPALWRPGAPAGYGAGRGELSSAPSHGSATERESRRRLAGVGSAERSATGGQGGLRLSLGRGAAASALRGAPTAVSPGGRSAPWPARSPRVSAVEPRGAERWVRGSRRFPLWWLAFWLSGEEWR